MNFSSNTILITGGGSGIGRGLAEAFHRAGNQVIITGRRVAVLEEVARANPGMKAMALDVADAGEIARFAAELKAEAPGLNVLINNAGMMQAEDLQAGVKDLAVAEATIATNLLGPLRLTAALLPGLLAQPSAAVMTVTSGLAFVPIATNPAYCASKAAIHSWTQSLRFQLRGTSVEVIEIAPPYVQTELTGAHQASDPNAMQLEQYLAETVELLKAQPASEEILVKRVERMRFAERDGMYAAVYAERNAMAMERMRRGKG